MSRLEQIVSELTMENGELRATLEHKNLQIEKLREEITTLEVKLVLAQRQRRYQIQRYRNLQETTNAQR